MNPKIRRRWFKDQNGGYYRNAQLVDADRKDPRNRRSRGALAVLDREWWDVFRQGVVRADTIGRRDKVVEPALMRVAYPDSPTFWMLDHLACRKAYPPRFPELMASRYRCEGCGGLYSEDPKPTSDQPRA